MDVIAPVEVIVHVNGNDTLSVIGSRDAITTTVSFPFTCTITITVSITSTFTITLTLTLTLTR